MILCNTQHGVLYRGAREWEPGDHRRPGQRQEGAEGHQPGRGITAARPGQPRFHVDTIMTAAALWVEGLPRCPSICLAFIPFIIIIY